MWKGQKDQNVQRDIINNKARKLSQSQAIGVLNGKKDFIFDPEGLWCLMNKDAIALDLCFRVILLVDVWRTDRKNLRRKMNWEIFHNGPGLPKVGTE